MEKNKISNPTRNGADDILSVDFYKMASRLGTVCINDKQIGYSLQKIQTLRGLHKPALRVNGKVLLLLETKQTVFAALRVAALSDLSDGPVYQ